ncbi:MAG: peptide deformylase [SAR324 cluster bacterium]|nr:peptide deformylase [SAR324 cluster bacterium]
MDDYKLILFPDIFLKRKISITPFRDNIIEENLINHMFTIMHQYCGIGLAANQIGLDKRIFVMDVSPFITEEIEPDLADSEHLSATEKEPKEPEELKDISTQHNHEVFINPAIIDKKNIIPSMEGCLSIPGTTAEIERYHNIKVNYYDQHWQLVERDLVGLSAICFQHELDHLDGKLFWEHLPPIQRGILQKRHNKQQMEDDSE